MMQPATSFLKVLFTFRWQPGKDLAAVIVSWFLVVGGLYTASMIVGPTLGGGLPYFFLYAVVTATLFGVGIPLYWMVVVRKRPISDLGITSRALGLSLVIQVILAILLFLIRLRELNPPALDELIPLIALALTIGFFEVLILMFILVWLATRRLPKSLANAVVQTLFAHDFGSLGHTK